MSSFARSTSLSSWGSKGAEQERGLAMQLQVSGAVQGGENRGSWTVDAESASSRSVLCRGGDSSWGN